MWMFTDRNYRAIYSHTTSTDKSVLQRKHFAIVMCFFMKNNMVSYEQVCVRNRTMKEIAAIVIYAYNICGHCRHRNIQTVVNGAYLQHFIFQTVQLLIWLNVFIRLLTHRLTTVVVILHSTLLLCYFHWEPT